MSYGRRVRPRDSLDHYTTARTIEFETTEVTEADVALSPDGRWLIFTMLGHLFQLPVEGGTAVQLTFGPYYDTDPVISPDGGRAAFISDRDGSEGNVFTLELATGEITQVTHESWAGRPTWTPDGRAIVYLRFVSKAGMCPTGEALVRRIPLSGREAETLSAPARVIRSVFYLPDGRLAWTVIDPGPHVGEATTRIEVASVQGTVSTLRTIEAIGDRVATSPTGDELYFRGRRSRYIPLYGFFGHPEDLLSLPLPEGPERHIATLSVPWCFYRVPQFAVAPDNKSVYLGDAGRLWKIALPSGDREPIAFRARVKLEVQDPVPPPKWAPPVFRSSGPPRSILYPRLSPDGRSLVFEALGYLWQQPLDGGSAQRLFEGSAFERHPAFSPDGRQLAFVHYEYGKREVRVFDLESRQTRMAASGRTYTPSWSPDGQRLVFAEWGGDGFGVVSVNLSDGKKDKLAHIGYWRPRPHFSADGQLLYFTTDTTAIGALYRLPLKDNVKPKPVTELARHLSDGLVSPDGKWLAFRRNSEIWVARLSKEPVKEEDIRRLSAEGGRNFSFTPGGSALLYSVGNRVWRHPIEGGRRREISIRLELSRPTPPPLLVQRVRVLDFTSAAFSPETSLFIDQGRIRWFGSRRGRKLPQETVTLDAGGRFAIPGLFDLHMHTFGGGAINQEAYLAYGVTSVREPGGSLAWRNALADRAEATSNPAPRCFFSGEFFEGSHPPSGDFYLLIHNEEEARVYVRRWKARGAQFIKAYATLPWPLARAVAKEAHRLGLPVVGHGTHVEEITKGVTLGYAFLEHTNWPSRFYDDVLQLFAVAGTRWDPTLAIKGGNSLLLRDEPERLAGAKLRAFAPEQEIHEAQMWHKAVDKNVLRGSRFEQLAAIRAAHRRGVKLQVGTDSGVPGILPGASLHWEMEHFVQAGLSPLEVLRIATQEAAAAVGAEDDLGTLEPGKLADIVLLAANPLEDIKNTQTVWRVIKGGWLFDPEKLRPAVSTSNPE